MDQQACKKVDGKILDDLPIGFKNYPFDYLVFTLYKMQKVHTVMTRIKSYIIGKPQLFTSAVELLDIASN